MRKLLMLQLYIEKVTIINECVTKLNIPVTFLITHSWIKNHIYNH